MSSSSFIDSLQSGDKHRVLQVRQKKDMENEIKYQFLFYDFIYDGIRHRAKIKLEEDNHCVRMLYDEHNLEVTWEKRIRHRGKHMIISIVLKDNWNDWKTLGQVVASAWVSVYDISDRVIINQFEPDYWSFNKNLDEILDLQDLLKQSIRSHLSRLLFSNACRRFFASSRVRLT